MVERNRRHGGFTLIEVTFATGILFLTLALILGALSHIALVRELGERRHLANLCLDHCLEQLHRQAPSALEEIHLSPPDGLPGTYAIAVTAAEFLDGAPAARIAVTTRATRGHTIEASAIYVLEGSPHAP